jgi:hypothetical protein
MIIDCFNTSTAVSVYHLHTSHFVTLSALCLMLFVLLLLLIFEEQLDQRPFSALIQHTRTFASLLVCITKPLLEEQVLLSSLLLAYHARIRPIQTGTLIR